MSSARTAHQCAECGALAPRWTGRCGSCGGWNTLAACPSRSRSASRAAAQGWDEPCRPCRVTDVDTTARLPAPTGIHELDRVLGGGFVEGSVTLLGGEPGIGKSTLALQALGAIAAAGRRALLVSAEESSRQVRSRAERLGSMHPDLWLAAETRLPAVLAALEEVDPAVVVVDSVQTVVDPEVGSAPGSVSQVRECTRQVTAAARERGIVVLLVGHVTKDGSLAGPRVLEHGVDTVLSFEGDRHHALRVLRALKHRFGPTGEPGIFEMAGEGLVCVDDPSALLLADRRSGVPGGVVVPAVEGRRTMLVELQALVAPSVLAQPRRSAQGLDATRLALVLAVLEQRAGVGLRAHDAFASVAGGVRVTEPGADLGLGLALVSAATGIPLADDLVACGEVGLGGEVRQVAHTAARLAEASRAGFGRAIVPLTAPDGPAGMRLVRVASVEEAATYLGLLCAPAVPSTSRQ